jgi:hypothetical protein
MEYLAVRNGIAWLAWCAGILFWLAFYEYTKHKLLGKTMKYRYGLPALMALALGIGTFALTRINPSLVSESKQDSKPPEAKPEDKKDDKKGQDPKKPEAKPKPKTEPNPTPPVGPIEQGACSNLQIGGSSNQATVNCGPPPPVFALKLLKENVKLSENSYRTDYQLDVKTKTAFPSLHVRAEGGVGTADGTPCLMVLRVVAGGATGNHRDRTSGYGFCDVHAPDIRSGRYLIEVFSTTPTKVNLTYEPD